MSADLEQKLVTHGENNLRLIRVSEGGMKNRFIGNILVSCRRYKEGNTEMISVRVLPLSVSSRVASMNDKLSLNKFEAVINHSDRMISFAPLQGMQLEEHLQNYGIGTYAFNILVTELRRAVPGYAFIPYEIVLGEECSASDREKLISFLNKFGINLNFVDLEQRAATMRASTPLQLIPHYNEDKVQELDLEEYLFQLISDRVKNENEITNMRTEIDRMSQESFGGIPKKQLVKYTLICCGITLLIVFALII